MAKIACCHNCAYSYWDRDHTVQCVSLGVMNWPACANHPESLGRMQRTPDRGMCVNYRPRLATPKGEAVKTIPLADGIYAYVDAADYAQRDAVGREGRKARRKKGKTGGRPRPRGAGYKPRAKSAGTKSQIGSVHREEGIPFWSVVERCLVDSLSVWRSMAQ
jgi:hypothetical protein